MTTTETEHATGLTLAASRQRRIIKSLRASGELQVVTLAEEFGVSAETIRRDLKILEELGQLKRVHGGAVLSSLSEESYEQRRVKNASSKERIANCFAASNILQEGDLVFLGGGSTTLALAEKLGDMKPLRIVTNAIDIATTMASNPAHDVTLTGGKISRTHELLTGEETLSSVADLVFDVVITSTNCVHPKFGTIEFYEAEANLHRAVRQNTRTYVLLADHSKFRISSGYRSLDFVNIDILVTDEAPSDDYLGKISEVGVQLLKA